MYGTVARLRARPGMEAKLLEHLREFEKAKVPGTLGVMVYRMDQNPNDYYLAVAFDSKDSYFANANSPQQDLRYRKLLEMLDGEPEWHDGEIVYSQMLAGRQAGQK